MLHRIFAKRHQFDKEAGVFLYHHPYTAFVALFLGMPIFILLTIFLATSLVVLPVSWAVGLIF